MPWVKSPAHSLLRPIFNSPAWRLRAKNAYLADGALASALDKSAIRNPFIAKIDQRKTSVRCGPADRLVLKSLDWSYFQYTVSAYACAAFPPPLSYPLPGHQA